MTSKKIATFRLRHFREGKKQLTMGIDSSHPKQTSYSTGQTPPTGCYDLCKSNLCPLGSSDHVARAAPLLTYRHASHIDMLCAWSLDPLSRGKIMA
jgi:hypothetical protein